MIYLSSHQNFFKLSEALDFRLSKPFFTLFIPCTEPRFLTPSKLLLCNFANHAGIHNKPENLKILQKMASGIVSIEELQKSFNEGVSFSKLPVLGNIVKQN
ncbi:MAG: hypothetical protein HQM10_09900 [Candidatus Riflebacteria bacterium]|nr:hypothetical protein [Candidatus Riflebacteria bacterium]